MEEDLAITNINTRLRHQRGYGLRSVVDLWLSLMIVVAEAWCAKSVGTGRTESEVGVGAVHVFEVNTLNGSV